MADKQVNIAVNVAAGQDQLTPVLQKQRAAAESTAEALARLKKEAESIRPPQPAAQLSAARVQAQEVARGRGQFGADEYGAALQQARAEREEAAARQQQQAVMNRARAQLAGGIIPEGAVNVAGGGGGAGAALSSLRAAFGGLAGGAGDAGQRLMALRQAATGAASAVMPAVAAFGAVAAAAATLSQAFRPVRDDIGSIIANLRQQHADLQQGRQTGTAGPDTLRRAFNQAEERRFAEAQARGDRPGQEAVLREAEARHMETLRTQGDPAAAQARLRQELEEIERLRRAPAWQQPYRAPWEHIPTWEERRQEAMRRAGVPEGMIGNTGSGILNQQQIRDIAALAGGRSVEAQAGVEAIRNARRPGGLPDLRPGALNLQDLPGLFTSRQLDSGDIHSQIQQELVRDPRQEAQFQAQMALWERILQQIERQSGVDDRPWWMRMAGLDRD